MNTALVLSYLGTGYHGWQRQNNGLTIQELLERAVRESCGLRDVYVSGCGRTDAGVHAAFYVCNFKGEVRIPADKLPLALNARLPEAVAVRRAVPVAEDFDARFSCRSKEYTYLIHNSRVRDPFLLGRACFYPQPLDERLMTEAARHFVGRQDFAAVRNLGTPVRSTVRTVLSCTAERRGDRLRVRVAADGFLYNMVRAIAGTLIYVGIGKLRPDEIADVLRSGDRDRAGPTAPACGLYLTALDYGLPSLDGRAELF
jgi:tRNA pseudouridine38-40 synthase